MWPWKVGFPDTSCESSKLRPTFPPPPKLAFIKTGYLSRDRQTDRQHKTIPVPLPLVSLTQSCRPLFSGGNLSGRLQSNQELSELRSCSLSASTRWTTENILITLLPINNATFYLMLYLKHAVLMCPHVVFFLTSWCPSFQWRRQEDQWTPPLLIDRDLQSPGSPTETRSQDGWPVFNSGQSNPRIAHTR